MIFELGHCLDSIGLTYDRMLDNTERLINNVPNSGNELLRQLIRDYLIHDIRMKS